MAVTQRSHHLTLDGVGYTLYQEPDKPAATGGASDLVEPPGIQLDPMQSPGLWDDLSGGMGNSRRTKEAPNTYDYATSDPAVRAGPGICTRYQGWVMPAGALTEYDVQGAAGVPAGDEIV